MKISLALNNTWTGNNVLETCWVNPKRVSVSKHWGGGAIKYVLRKSNETIINQFFFFLKTFSRMLFSFSLTGLAWIIFINVEKMKYRYCFWTVEILWKELLRNCYSRMIHLKPAFPHPHPLPRQGHVNRNVSKWCLFFTWGRRRVCNKEVQNTCSHSIHSHLMISLVKILNYF